MNLFNLLIRLDCEDKKKYVENKLIEVIGKTTMEYSKEYNELKKVVRAILVSLKRKGVAVSVLEEIYREREGKNIPLFGYSDTIGVLNSLTDTVDMVSTVLPHFFKLIPKCLQIELTHRSHFKPIEITSRSDVGFSS